MRCLTHNESIQWLSSLGAQIDGNRNIVVPARAESIMVTMPKSASLLILFAARLIDWLPPNCERLLWLANWETIPNQIIFFEKLRNGLGEVRSPIEAPGHLFESSTKEENSVFAALIFLVMTFNWEGYILAKNQIENLYLGDQFIVFSSGNVNKIKEISKLIDAFQLNIITDIKQAWK